MLQEIKETVDCQGWQGPRIVGGIARVEAWGCALLCSNDNDELGVGGERGAVLSMD
jgi:hypothetical protein